MDYAPQNQPPVKPLPIGTSIQAGANAIMAIIDAERVNAASARDQCYKLERMFNVFRQHSMTIHAKDQAQLADANQTIQHLQHRLAQSQSTTPRPIEDASQLAVVPAASQYNIEVMRNEVSRVSADAIEARREVALAKSQLDELQTALQKVGIGFSREENSLRFEAWWAVVLAEIEGTERRSMNPDELQRMLGNLTRRLQSDREKIQQAEQQLLASDKEREQMANNYENMVASLNHEISTLQGLASSKSSGEHSFQSPQLFADTQAVHSSPLDQSPWSHQHIDIQNNFLETDDLFQPSAIDDQDEQANLIAEQLLNELTYANEVPSAPRIDLRSVQPETRRKSHKHTPSVGLLTGFDMSLAHLSRLSQLKMSA